MLRHFLHVIEYSSEGLLASLSLSDGPRVAGDGFGLGLGPGLGLGLADPPHRVLALLL